MVTIGDTLFVIYKGVAGDSGIYVSHSSIVAHTAQQQWTDAQRLPEAVNTTTGPGAVMQGGVLYVVYKGMDTSIFVLRSADAGSTWYMAALTGSSGTDDAPGAAILNGQPYVVYKGVDPDPGIYVEALPANLTWQQIS
jgi:hypothetical protein